ncbi:C40 family peptidase [Smaragdicoccus niigatensis]|uniref:C40 family peptidase n=1 Tax=Smaragdicoccus niigatensis TaxID=359359 RepID=UPI00037A7FF1|nr:C40 family peptidase [Smaragdicoccus niigatensis]
MFAEPIVQLLGTFGTGNLGSATPGFANAQSSMHCAQDSGRRGMNNLSGWSGTSGEAATTTAQTNQSQMADQSDRGQAIARVVSQAAQTVGGGKLDVQGILESFTSVATTLAPMLGLPAGQIALLKTAAEHIGDAVNVVQGVNQQMGQHTEQMSALASPDLGSSAAKTVNTGTGVAVTLPDGSTAMAPNEQAATAVRSALSQQGVPYAWGGTTPAGFDCSGLTQYAYQQAGVDLPRMAADQGVGTSVPADQLMPGDLAVWDGHVAMVVGNGQMIEAGDPVEISAIRTDNQGEAFHGFYRPTA